MPSSGRSSPVTDTGSFPISVQEEGNETWNAVRWWRSCAVAQRTSTPGRGKSLWYGWGLGFAQGFAAPSDARAAAAGWKISRIFCRTSTADCCAGIEKRSVAVEASTTRRWKPISSGSRSGWLSTFFGLEELRRGDGICASLNEKKTSSWTARPGTRRGRSACCSAGSNLRCSSSDVDVRWPARTLRLTCNCCGGSTSRA